MIFVWIGGVYSKDLQPYQCVILKGNIQAVYHQSSVLSKIEKITNEKYIQLQQDKKCLIIANRYNTQSIFSWMLHFFHSYPITFDLYGKALQTITLSGGASLMTDSLDSKSGHYTLSGGSKLSIKELHTQVLQMNLSGGSIVLFSHLFLNSFQNTQSGGGKVTITQGQGKEMHLKGSGGMKFYGEDFKLQKVFLNLSGGATVKVYVDQLLNIQASGGSEIMYGGSPEIHQHISGGAQIIHKEQ